MTFLFFIVVVLVGPLLPILKFFIAAEHISCQARNRTHRISIYERIPILFVQNIQIVVIKHFCNLQILEI